MQKSTINAILNNFYKQVWFHRSLMSDQCWLKWEWSECYSDYGFIAKRFYDKGFSF